MSAAFGLAVAVVVAAFWLSHRNTERLVEAGRSTEHTHQAITQIHMTLSLLRDASANAFALSGDDQTLAPLARATAEVAKQIAALRAMVADNPAQQRRIEALEELARARIAAAQEVASARRSGGLLRAAEAARTLASAKLMADTRALLGEMEADERRLLAERIAAAAQTRVSVDRTLLAGAAVGVGLLVAVFLALSHEVHQRRRAQEQRAASEGRLQAILDHTHAVVFVKDRARRYLLVNRRWETLFHHKPEDVLGKTDHDLFPKEVADAFRSNDERVLTTGAPFEAEEVAPHDDGPHTYISLKIPLRAADGEIYGICGVATDITDLKSTEEALRKTQEDLALAQEAGRIGIWNQDVRTGETFYSPGLERLLGVEPGTLAHGHRHWRELIHPEDLEHLDRSSSRAIEEQSEWAEEFRILRPDGKIRWIGARGRVLRDSEGQPLRFLGASVDLTERKGAEEQLRRAKETAETASRELEAFSYSVSHDLRAPLRAIDGFTQVFLDDCGAQVDAQGHEYLQRIRAGAQRMGQLIDDLLHLSRVSRVELQRRAVDLSRLAREVAGELRAQAPARAAQFVIEDGLVAHADSRLVRVALENLLANAWKFTGGRPEARIEFGAAPGNGSEVFYVRDNGVGFDMAYSHHLFAPFQRLHSRKEFEGSGIGLATVARIVQRHGGRVWAEGEVDRGATVFFTLPRGA